MAGPNPDLVITVPETVTVDLHNLEGSNGSHHIVGGYTITQIAVVQGLLVWGEDGTPVMPGETTDTPVDTAILYQMAEAAVVAIVGPRGTPCMSLTVWTYLEEFVLDLLSNDAVRIKIVYRGYPAAAYRFEGAMNQHSVNKMLAVDPGTGSLISVPIVLSYTYPSDYVLNTLHAGKTVNQGGRVPKDIEEPCFSYSFVVSYFVGTLTLVTNGVTQTWTGTTEAPITATEFMSILGMMAGKSNDASFTIGKVVGSAGEWQIRAVEGFSRDAGRTYYATIVFQYRKGGWDPTVTFTNPDDGLPPADVVAGVGQYQARVLDRITFWALAPQEN